MKGKGSFKPLKPMAKKERWTKWSVVYFSKVESFSWVTLIRVYVFHLIHFFSFICLCLGHGIKWKKQQQKRPNVYIRFTKRVYNLGVLCVLCTLGRLAQLNRESLNFSMAIKLFASKFLMVFFPSFSIISKSLAHFWKSKWFISLFLYKYT